MPRRRRPDQWYLFGVPAVVADFLRRFCGAWSGELDLATLERVTSVLQSKSLQERRPDQVWRAARRDGQGFVYIAFEFQSRPDPQMPLRVLEYQTLLLGELLRARSLQGKRTGTVVSVVTCSGVRAWRVPKGRGECIGLGRYGLGGHGAECALRLHRHVA